MMSKISQLHLKKLFYLYLIFSIFKSVSANNPTFNDNPGSQSEWGFKPVDRSLTDRNPPGFAWRPQSGAIHYQIQISDNTSFTNIIHSKQDITFNVYCPSVTLPAKKLYWRVAYFTGSEWSEWSKIRSFTISHDAVDFPMPTFHELTSRVPKEHPRLFVRPEQIPYLQQLAKGDLKKQYRALVEECERIMKNPPPTAEPPLYPEGTVKLSEEWRAIWWRNRTYTTNLLNSAATLGFTRLLDGNEGYGQMAKKLLLAATEWDPKGSTGYLYNDEAGMPFSYYFSRTYTYIHDLLNEEEQKRCIEIMKIRGDEMYNHLYPRHLWYPYASHSNRAWHFLGEIGIAFLNEIEDADKWIWFASNVFYNVYPVWSDSDGGWHEGAAYWLSYLNRITWWIDIQKTAFNIDAYDMPFFANAGDYAIYVMPPNTPDGGFGDQAETVKAKSNRGLLTILATQAQNGYWMDYVNRIGGPSYTGGYIGFIRGAQKKTKPKSIDKLPSSKLFKGTGLAMLHSDLTDAQNDVHIHFKSSPFGKQSHGYDSQNSFLLYAYGEPLLIRSGHRDISGSDHHKNWMWSTRSVNSIKIGGEDQIRSGLGKGKIVGFHTSDQFDYVAGEANTAYPKGTVDKFTRHIIYAKPHAIIIIDDIRTPDPQTSEWWLHSPLEMQIVDQHSIEARVGDVSCHINMLYPKDLKLTQTDLFDPPPRERIKLRQWHLSAETTEKREHLQFITVLHPYRSKDKPSLNSKVEFKEDGFVVTTDTDNGSVTVKWEGPSLQYIEDSSTKEIITAVLKNRNGKVISEKQFKPDLQ